LLLVALAVQFTPESVDVYICPPRTLATNFVPSLEDATAFQARFVSLAVQFTPESVDV